MKKYQVNVNGTNYIIEIEEIGSPSAASTRPFPQARPAAPERAAVPTQATTSIPAAPQKAPVVSQTPAASAEGAAICAPMPGNILEVRVSNGQAVKKGDILFILEAMKMENEIMAPCNGTVVSVGVSAGSAVNSGTLLCSIQ